MLSGVAVITSLSKTRENADSNTGTTASTLTDLSVCSERDVTSGVLDRPHLCRASRLWGSGEGGRGRGGGVGEGRVRTV